MVDGSEKILINIHFSSSCKTINTDDDDSKNKIIWEENIPNCLVGFEEMNYKLLRTNLVLEFRNLGILLRRTRNQCWQTHSQ